MQGLWSLSGKAIVFTQLQSGKISDDELGMGTIQTAGEEDTGQ